MKVHRVEQGGEKWLALRLGRPTASRFDDLVTPEGRPRTGQTPQTYALDLAMERVSGRTTDTPQTAAMERGRFHEAAAVGWYELLYDDAAAVERVGFVEPDDGLCGCSPDALVGAAGGLEVKCPMPRGYARALLDGQSYKAQVQGCLWICEREWWDLLIYPGDIPGVAPVVRKFVRDEKYIDALRCAVAAVAQSVGETEAALREIMGNESANKGGEDAI